MKRDLRDYARQTTIRLLIGGILLLFIVGDGLVYWIYGPSAALAGLLCLGAGLFPVLLIFLVLSFLDWIVKRANRE
ncbi:hypothetical protein ATHL_01524 [Anaerolinea thermolimosa]|uniref:hypothetical protein n=1 Tax=Anaerolinea thermolimosa TaxID=229919 RepID=UPI0007819900|nr:hypothetical protein [Anaerolinea thermolimosa]GAP06668.1 hypothetical protein ATHL_01524 [Anaerolinea thermolimosa]